MNLKDKIKAAKDKASKKKRVVTKTKQPKGESKHIVRRSGKPVDVYKGDDGVKTRVVTDATGDQKGKTKYPGGSQKWTVKDGVTEWAPAKGKKARDAKKKKKNISKKIQEWGSKEKLQGQYSGKTKEFYDQERWSGLDVYGLQKKKK